MKSKEFKLNSYGCEIFGMHTHPVKTKAVIVLVHGFGEHSGRYADKVIPMLMSSGLAVFAYDNIGHGKTTGKRGHCPSYDALLNILSDVIAKAENIYPNVPLFLYGHSMGGNLVLNYAIKRDVNLAGIIATSPYLRLAFQPPQWKILLGKLMLNIFPSITMPSGLDPKGISRIHEEVEKYKNDPLVHDKVSPMYSFPIMDAGEWAIENAFRLNDCTFLLHGTADQIIDYKATEEFHQNSTKTTLKLIEAGFHELHNDLCSNEMLEEISNWLKVRLVNIS